MEYLIGALAAIIGVLIIKKSSPTLTRKEKKEEAAIESQLQGNREKIEKEAKELNEIPKVEKKSLSDLVEYFKRIGK